MTPTSVESDRVLILDDISDPGNLGTLIRSAVAFGFTKIIVSNDTCDIYNAKVLRGSQGALFYAEIIKGDIVEEINKLKGYRIIGTSLEGKTLESQEINGKIALVLGNESRGMKSEILAICDDRFLIDINTVDSLNVAIAGSIIMYQFKI